MIGRGCERLPLRRQLVPDPRARAALAPLVAAVSALGARGSTRRWRRLRALVLDRDAHRCQVPVDGGTASNGAGVCGARATHVDHVLPRLHGGGDQLDNLRAACASCNLRRGARTAEDVPPAASTRAHLARTGWSW